MQFVGKTVTFLHAPDRADEDCAVQKGTRGPKAKHRWWVDPALKDLDAGVAYLAQQAENNPTAFMSLLGRVIPAKIDMEVRCSRTRDTVAP